MQENYQYEKRRSEELSGTINYTFFLRFVRRFFDTCMFRLFLIYLILIMFYFSPGQLSLRNKEVITTENKYKQEIEELKAKYKTEKGKFLHFFGHVSITFFFQFILIMQVIFVQSKENVGKCTKENLQDTKYKRCLKTKSFNTASMDNYMHIIFT